MPSLIFIIIALTLSFGFLNGMHDSRNVVTTMISSRAYPPRIALGVTILAEISGPFVFGVAVANSIGRGIAEPAAVDLKVILAALVTAILWNLFTWQLKVPSSSSHALIGGIVGAASAHAGAGAIKMDGLIRILVSLFASPIIGFIFGFVLLKIVLALCWDANPRINNFFKRSQLLTALALGLSHGSNDGQKTMGVITLALFTGGYIQSFTVPFWVVCACALALALGTAAGGWTLLRRPSRVYYTIRPVDGFTTQLTSALVIIGASLTGGPVSATQVINTAIIGVGAAERANKVRWGMAMDIVTAWVLTIPATASVAMAIFWLIDRFLF